MVPVSTIRRTRPPGRVFALPCGQSGFTVVELVVVMVLLGILAASAMPRFFEASRFDEMGFADATGAALRYAQKLALASRCDTRVRIDASGYAVFQRASGCTSGALTRPVSRPGGNNWSRPVPAGVVVGSLDLYFDSQGRPRSVSSSALHNAAQSVSIGTRTLTVEHTTGYTRSG